MLKLRKFTPWALEQLSCQIGRDLHSTIVEFFFLGDDVIENGLLFIAYFF